MPTLALPVQVLGASIGDDEPLMSAGLDSLGSVEFANVLSQKLGLQVPSTLVFDHPTVTAVTAYLAAQMLKSAAAAAAAAPEAQEGDAADASPAVSQDAELAYFGGPARLDQLSAEVPRSQRHLAVSAVATRSLMAETFAAPEQVKGHISPRILRRKQWAVCL
jgi:acyl carrier protein